MGGHIQTLDLKVLMEGNLQNTCVPMAAVFRGFLIYREVLDYLKSKILTAV